MVSLILQAGTSGNILINLTHCALPNIPFPTMRRYLQPCTYLLLVLVLKLWNHRIESVCTPFSYYRQPECSDSLAASTFPLCSSMNLSLERKACEVESLDDMDALWTIARVLGLGYVSLTYSRVDSRFASSQWEAMLLCNDVSHWLGASL